jgi:hypothetical protein
MSIAKCVHLFSANFLIFVGNVLVTNVPNSCEQQYVLFSKQIKIKTPASLPA